MDKAEKKEMVAYLDQVFSESGAVVVTHYAGLTVAQLTDLRRKMAAVGAKFKVAKNRLAKIALDNTGRSAAAHLFKGQTGIAFAKDPVAAAKVALDYAKTNDKLIILGGVVGKSAVDEAGIKALASMPPIEQMRSKLLGALNAPGSKLVGTLNAPGQKLARQIAAPGQSLVGVLQAWKQKQEQGSEAA